MEQEDTELAGTLRRGFVFHAVPGLSSKAALADEWHSLESSLCNCQAVGFKLGFQQVFQSDQEI